MYTNPSSQRVIECVREAIEKDLVPELQSETAKVTAQMIGPVSYTHLTLPTIYSV